MNALERIRQATQRGARLAVRSADAQLLLDVMEAAKEVDAALVFARHSGQSVFLDIRGGRVLHAALAALEAEEEA